MRCPKCRDTGFVWLVPGHAENGMKCGWRGCNIQTVFSAESRGRDEGATTDN